MKIKISKPRLELWEKRIEMFISEGKVLFHGTNNYPLTNREINQASTILETLYNLWKKNGFKRITIKKKDLLKQILKENTKVTVDVLGRKRLAMGGDSIQSIMNIMSGAFIKTSVSYNVSNIWREYETTPSLIYFFKQRYYEETGINLNDDESTETKRKA